MNDFIRNFFKEEDRASKVLTRGSVAIMAVDLGDRDFSNNTRVYFSDDYTCIDSDLSSASGTAIRHRTVYLLNTKL
jgi:hypothetical protein